jgi:phosphopantothenoylcysteine decarboxylase
VRQEEWGGEKGWFDVLRPQEKILACNDVGDGALRDWQEIVKIIEEKLNLDSYRFSGERWEDELL